MKTFRRWKGLRPGGICAYQFANGHIKAMVSGALALLVALMPTACSNDEDEYHADQLAGTWLKVYDEGVVAEGFVQYTFTPENPSGSGNLNASAPETPGNELKGAIVSSGNCTIRVYDVFAGDTTILRGYALTDYGRRLFIFERMYGGTPQMQKYDVRQMSDTEMSWQLEGTDVVLNFRKTNDFH